MGLCPKPCWGQRFPDSYYITNAAPDGFVLNITGAIGGTPKYTVRILDEDTMELYLGSTLTFQFSRYAAQNNPDTQDGSPAFSITGNWTQTYGRGTWSLYTGRIVAFESGGHCNLWSPYDSYSISDAGGDGFTLNITGVLGGGPRYTVRIADQNTMELYLSSEMEFVLVRQN